MSNQIRIPAKILGEIALSDFCPRCFWIKLHVSKLPYQIFPGIFSSIDTYTKRVVHGWFDNLGSAPPWLQSLGDLMAYKNAPHFSKFNVIDSETNILLAGSPDDIFLLRDNSHIIADYKTAKYTGTQDVLFPMYEAQLNAYAFIGMQRGLEPISGLALVYMEPITDNDAAKNNVGLRENGFVMDFSANVHMVNLNIGIIPPLLREARRIYDMNATPFGLADCRNCPLVDELVALADI